MARGGRSDSRGVLCTKCRNLISNQAKACPHCGAVQPNLFGFGESLRVLYRDVLEPVQLLTVACVALYVISLGARMDSLLEFRGLMDLGAPDGDVLYVLGMTGGFAWACGYAWTLLSANLLHGSLLHIAFNLSWLRTLGATAVGTLGPARFLVLFFGSGVGGFLFSNLLGGAPTIGASCGLFGLLGGLAVFGWRRGGTMGAALRGNMLYWAGVGFAFSFLMPGINILGHLGGLLAGGAIALLFPKHEGRHEPRGVQLLGLAVLLATLVSVGLSIWSMWDVYQTGIARCRW